LVIARHCSGGVILGFEQFSANSGTWKRGTREQKKLKKATAFPSSWNHLEAGVLFGLGIPLLVFKEPDISGGVFDSGVTDVFVHTMPTLRTSKQNKIGLIEVFRKWQGRVRDRYYFESERREA